MLANFLAAALACVRVVADLICSDAFQTSAMLVASMHLFDMAFSGSSGVLVFGRRTAVVRSCRAPPLTAFNTATAICLTTISFRAGRAALSAKFLPVAQHPDLYVQFFLFCSQYAGMSHAPPLIHSSK